MKQAKVLFDYTAAADNQISLKAGQVINIVHDGGKGSWSKAVEIPSGNVLWQNISALVNHLSLNL
jgi:hypothetical protein